MEISNLEGHIARYHLWAKHHFTNFQAVMDHILAIHLPPDEMQLQEVNVATWFLAY
jgi:hypothetical protein